MEQVGDKNSLHIQGWSKNVGGAIAEKLNAINDDFHTA